MPGDTLKVSHIPSVHGKTVRLQLEQQVKVQPGTQARVVLPSFTPMSYSDAGLGARSSSHLACQSETYADF